MEVGEKLIKQKEYLRASLAPYCQTLGNSSWV